MGFRDYPMPQLPTSYISSHEVLSYIISYAEHFQLNELIKFKHHVRQVQVADANKWKVCLCAEKKLFQHNINPKSNVQYTYSQGYIVIQHA